MNANNYPIPDPTTRPACRRLDAADPLAEHRSLFELPDGIIYLDGNSLGPLPKSALVSLHHCAASEWAEGLVRSWNAAGWFDAPIRLGEKLAPLIGAHSNEVAVSDSMSVNLFKLLVAALRIQSDRRTILADSDNFPSDLYVAQSVAKLLNADLRRVASENLRDSIDERTAIVFASHVDYRTARMHDMAGVTEWAHRHGAMVLWNLAHSAGAVPLNLSDWSVDLAVGCGYKYLNGGPGAPSFVYVAEKHHATLDQPLTGWFGAAHPFEFTPEYRPAAGIRQTLCGTPPILAYAALEASLDIWADIDMHLVRAKSIALAEVFNRLVSNRFTEKEVRPASPSDPDVRGSHLSFHCAHAYPVMQALIDRGVIGDMRQPDLIRFGLTPLYLGFEDVWNAVGVLEQVVHDRLWDRREYLQRKTVT